MKKVFFIATFLLTGLYTSSLQAQSCCSKSNAGKSCATSKSADKGAAAVTPNVAKSDAPSTWAIWSPGAQCNSGVATTVSQPASTNNKAANCNPTNCKPANCNPANCDVKSCDPAKCDPSGKCDKSKCMTGNGAKMKSKDSQI